MPNIPIDLTQGFYADTALRLSNREVQNCYPETSSMHGGTVIRAIENYQTREDTSTRMYGNSIMVGDTIYGVEFGGNFFSINVKTATYTSIGALPFPIFVNYRMATNGDSIVMVNFDTTNKAYDFYYDIGTSTLASISTKDATYSGFEKAVDVEYKDGYYVFITKNTIFHGDNFLSTGDGLAFNALSFTTIPAESGDGTGLAVANSQLYAFTSQSTLIYQTAPTTPFSFARATGFDLDLGLVDPPAKTVFEDKIFLLGKSSGSGSSAYIIEGQSYNQVSAADLDSELRDLSYRALLSSYRANGHRIITIRSHQYSGTATKVYALDYTESKLQSKPVWHTRELSDGFGGTWPIYEYFSTSESTGSLDSESFAMGVRNSGFRGTTLYQVKPTETIGDPTDFGFIGDRKFVYTLPTVRNEGEPFRIKSLTLFWSGNVQNVELFVSDDNETFSSLGSFDLTSVDTKKAQWRRINRFSDQATFKVEFDAVSSTEGLALIGGHYTV